MGAYGLLNCLFLLSGCHRLCFKSVRTLSPVPPDGRGLNPLLEDANDDSPAAALHGFVGLTVPFAFAIAALIVGKLTKHGSPQPAAGLSSRGSF